MCLSMWVDDVYVVEYAMTHNRNKRKNTGTSLLSFYLYIGSRDGTLAARLLRQVPQFTQSYDQPFSHSILS